MSDTERTVSHPMVFSVRLSPPFENLLGEIIPVHETVEDIAQLLARVVDGHRVANHRGQHEIGEHRTLVGFGCGTGGVVDSTAGFCWVVDAIQSGQPPASHILVLGAQVDFRVGCPAVPGDGNRRVLAVIEAIGLESFSRSSHVVNPR